MLERIGVGAQESSDITLVISLCWPFIISYIYEKGYYRVPLGAEAARQAFSSQRFPSYA